ncbi:tyrosine-type recombinase/integrase [Neobacillus sp. LXY-4]|uniref:tyrosine-type recombinase/integrase n=1 Tax=Neobacillus sp. LXY-4 TaxID=3379826 RepID=UPI003EDF19A4
MPYGFIQHIEARGYRIETVKSYQKVLNQFFSFLQSTYANNKEPFQISPSDIKAYLELQHQKKKSISTINKELAILKTFFNYLWEIEKVPIDPAVKLKRYKVKDNQNIDTPYDQILDILDKTLKNTHYSSLRKAIFVLAAKGLKTADFRFTKEDVVVSKSAGTVEIHLRNRVIMLEGREAACFREYYDESPINGNDYVFITKSHRVELPSPIQVMTILHHLRAISKDFLPGANHPLTLISIRRALAYYLYTKRYSIQMIAKELGIEENSASNYLKDLSEGMMLKKSL